MSKCYRIGCDKEATQKYKDKKSLCWLDPVCDDHQFIEPKEKITTVAEFFEKGGKMCECDHDHEGDCGKDDIEDLIETELSNCCSAPIIDGDRCSDCKEPCDADEVCEHCGGTGEVSVMEAVYPNEPHMADVGSQTCICKLRDPDDYDDQE